MAIQRIRHFPDPVLYQACQPIDTFDVNFHHLLEDLWDTLYHSPGVGLAAPQIGVLKQVSVIDTKRTFKKKSREDGSSHQLVLVNPVLEEGSGEQIPREGCLSVPDWLANVRRHEKVVVLNRNIDGELERIERAGFEALALQHEIDHLHGTLFIDRVRDIKTDLFRRQTYRKIKA